MVAISSIKLCAELAFLPPAYPTIKPAFGAAAVADWSTFATRPISRSAACVLLMLVVLVPGERQQEAEEWFEHVLKRACVLIRKATLKSGVKA
jgi:hypothetical protein